jgi:hypothetical protein
LKQSFREQFKEGSLSLENTPFLFSLFVGCYAAYQFLISSTLDLASFNGRMIGIATLHELSIPKRVGMFTNGLWIFLLVFSLCLWVLTLVKQRNRLSQEGIKTVNAFGFLGMGCLLFASFGITVQASLPLLFGLILLLLFFEGIMRHHQNSGFAKDHKFELICMSVMLSMCSYFLVKEGVNNLMNYPEPLPFNYFVIVTSAFLLWVSSVAKKAASWVNQCAFGLMPFLLLPLLSVFSDEFYFILNNRSIFTFSPKMGYISGLLLLVLWSVWRFFRFNKQKKLGPLRELLSRRYIPLFLISMGVFTFYTPFLDLRTEFFEVGNPALGIQRWYLFREIPLLETFNSHLWAELFYGFLYTAINGFKGFDYQLYYFLNRMVYGLVVYFFLVKFWKNTYAALLVTMLLAYQTIWIPRSFFMVLLMVFPVANLLNKKEVKPILWVVLMGVFLVLWRIDIGFANIIATAVTVLILHWVSTEKVPLRMLIKTTLIVGMLVAGVVYVVALLLGIPIIDNATEALHYLSSSQTYGYLNVFPEDQGLTAWHYFIFPFAIAIFVLYLIINGVRTSIARGERFAVVAVLYLAVFYFANMQRGIVRHGLVEGTDEVHTSFGFFILSVIPFFVFPNFSRNARIMMSIGLALLLISAFRLGGVANEISWYERFSTKVETYQHVQEEHKVIDRVLKPASYNQRQFEALDQLFGEMDDTATFLDFSNTPILYFLTSKRVPSYFNQNILSVHDDYLQEKAVAHFENFDIPYVVFSHFPENWYDAVDGVPNSLRHYKIAEHIFRNYQPFAIVSNFCVWQKKGIEHKLIPTQWIDSSSVLIPNEDDGVVLLDTLGWSESPGFQVIMTSDTVQLCHTNHQSVQLLARGEKRGYECYSAAFFPDLYSDRLRTFELKALPRIWQQYDPSTTPKEVVGVLAIQPTNAPAEVHMAISNPVDKSTGNYFLVELADQHNIAGEAELSFGIENEVQGRFRFDIDKKTQKYLIRVSTQYRWTAVENDYFRLKLPHTDAAAIIKSVRLLKGD